MMAAGIFALGAMVGSFLNVCAARLPKGKSLWLPGSACPACASPIRWYDNIPVLSFLLLRGRCRDCHERISWQYPIVEAGTALLFALAYLRFGQGAEFLLAIVLLSTLIVITTIDLEHQLIPDRITLPGIVVGFLGSVLLGRSPGLNSLVGIVVGGGAFFLIIVLSGGGMGGGDMKLGAMLGAFLGWKLLLLGLFVAAFLGGAVAVALLVTGRKGRKDPLPFGPFLAFGGAVSLFWGEEILQWYLSGFAG
jgi:leader peptidase (prepilin peptidase)/N-methyltransferase